MSRLRIDKSLKLFTFTVATVICLFSIPKTAIAVVTLVYFRAIPFDQQVVLEWETATELDNAGFFVQRSLNSNNGFSRIGDFILSIGDDLTGAFYQYVDTDVINGVTYWYKLEAIDYSQISELFEPAVSVIPGYQPTLTPTRTATKTPTPTQSGTVSTALFTSTRTATGTRTPIIGITQTPIDQNPYPGPSTPTTGAIVTGGIVTVDSSSEQVTVSEAENDDGLSGTATLIPVPEIVLNFPSETKGVEDKPGHDSDTDIPTEAKEDNLASSPIRTILLALILFFWSILLFLFLLYSRRIG